MYEQIFGGTNKFNCKHLLNCKVFNSTIFIEHDISYFFLFNYLQKKKNDLANDLNHFFYVVIIPVPLLLNDFFYFSPFNCNSAKIWHLQKGNWTWNELKNLQFRKKMERKISKSTSSQKGPLIIFYSNYRMGELSKKYRTNSWTLKEFFL
jgi:hypothetical protein